MVGMQIFVVSYLTCAGAFLFITLLVAVSGTRTRYRWWLALACAITTVWAVAVAAGDWPAADRIGLAGLGRDGQLVGLLEVLRNLAWLVFLGGLLGLGPERRRARRALGLTIAAPALATVALELVRQFDLLAPALATQLASTANLLFPVVGLVLLENIFRNADADKRWAVKFLCFGLGGLFAYDFFLYADALLFQRVDSVLFDARGVVNALAVPLIAVAVSRARSWSVDIHVSRQFVFHSATFLLAGLYLLVMAAAGLYLRNVGGSWGPVFQIVFFSGAVLILSVIFSSGAVRSRIKVFISKNFFSYKYDYRQEWLRLIQTISAGGQGIGLHHRIVRAVADIVGSPAVGSMRFRVIVKTGP